MSIVGTALRATFGVPESRGVGAAPSLSDWPWSIDPPTEFLSALAGGTLEQAVGLPAWLSVIRRLSQSAGITPLIVYRGERESRERADDSWQWRLLHGTPGDRRTPYNLTGDYAACMAACGNAFLRKIIVGRGRRQRVAELLVLDPRRVTPKRRNGQIVYEDNTGGALTVRSIEEIIHVRDLQFGDSGQDADLRGVNPIETLRTAVATGTRRQVWERAYFDNDARPGIALKFPDTLDEQTAKTYLELWNAEHQGTDNAGKAAALGGGADLVTIPPISLVDAQFVDSQRLNLQTIAGLYGMPPSLAGDTSEGGPVGEEAQIQFSIFGLAPLLTPLEQALTADETLFPPEEGPAFVEALTDAVIRADTKTRNDAYRLSRQGGWRTANEIRERENLPRHPDGDVLQVTPVGGGENPGAPAPDPDTSEEETSDE